MSKVRPEQDPFTIVKQNVKMLQAVEKYCPEAEILNVGSAMRVNPCPLGHHNDAFTVYEADGSSTANDEKGTYDRFYCYSCNTGGTVIDLYIHLKNLDMEADAYAACEQVAKDFNLELPKRSGNITQSLKNLAMDFYHDCLLTDTRTYAELDGRTPLKYQIEVRGHKLETLKRMKVGWTGGGNMLMQHFLSLGYDHAAIETTGLLNNKKSGDLFSRPLFIYPFVYKKNATRFSMKDPTKAMSYQQPKDYWTEGSMFYNYLDLEKHTKLLIVEGENDVISVMESDWDGGVIGTNGSIGKEQLSVLRGILTTSKKKIELVTAFDSDGVGGAGDKYRDKVTVLLQSSGLPPCVHIRPPTEDKDIDNYLKKGGTMAFALEKYVSANTTKDSVTGERSIDNSSIIEKNGCYYRRKPGKDGVVYDEQITDFIMRMSVIFLSKSAGRIRLIKVIHQAGFTAEVEITSEIKVSKHMFEIAVADSVDGTFMGNEKDLKDLWSFLFNTTPYSLVHLLDYCGFVKNKDFRVWVFRNCVIEPGGNILMGNKDEDDIFWINGNSIGIKAASQLEDASHGEGLPVMRILNSDQDYRELTKMFVAKFAENFKGNMLMTMIFMGWARANAYSDVFFGELGEFPILYMWGKHGRGKSTINKWVQNLYGMGDLGNTNVSNMGSGVGMERKASYYSSLPLSIDDMRNDGESKEYFSKFRGWYNRTGRTMGSREGVGKVVEVKVRANFMLNGEDIPDDPALRSRLIPVRIPESTKDESDTYHWLNSASDTGSSTSVGLYWILEASRRDPEEVIAKRRKTCLGITEATRCSKRTANVWSVVMLMAQELRDAYFPEYTALEADMYAHIKADVNEQQDGDILQDFWETLLSALTSERSIITEEHIIVDENKIYIWMSDMHARVMARYRFTGRQYNHSFSSIKQLMQESRYFDASGRYRVHGARKRLSRFDLGKAPDELKRIAEYASRNYGTGDNEGLTKVGEDEEKLAEMVNG